MSFSEIFVRRPVATMLLALGLFLAGIVAFRALRSRRCRASISRPSASPPSCPAPTRRRWRPPSPRRWSAAWARSPASPS
ncbi:MAG: hypothetical protein WDN72_07815 [Alphaproteobacteria bacterium]